MDFLILVGAMVVAVLVVGVSFISSQRPRRTSDESPKTVTQSLDYSILGQRPEIVTEDDSESHLHIPPRLK